MEHASDDVDNNGQFDDTSAGEMEETPVGVSQQMELEKMTNLVEVAYRNVGQQNQYLLRCSSLNSHRPSIGGISIQEESLTKSSMTSKLHSDHLSDAVHIQSSCTSSTDSSEDSAVVDLLALPPSLETALRVNRVLQQRFASSLTRLQRALNYNLSRQHTLSEEIGEEARLAREQEKELKDSSRFFLRISSFCVPYFKMKTFLQTAPRNEDGRYKVDQGYIDLYTIHKRSWMLTEKTALSIAVHKEWKAKALEEWKDQHDGLIRKKRSLSEKSPLSAEERITLNEIEKEIHQCEAYKKSFLLVDPLKLDVTKNTTELNWDKIAASTFDGHRTAEECQLMWENFLHPSINTSHWTEEEDLQIQDYVLKYECKGVNWDRLATQLNTGRTALMVMKRWVSFISPTLFPKKWTGTDTQILLDTINTLRIGEFIPWNQVHFYLPGFKKTQILSKWGLINPDVTRGTFTVEENITLIKVIHKYGYNINVLCYFLPGRTPVQIRRKIRQSVIPGLTSCPWTLEEDNLIINNGKKSKLQSRLLSRKLKNRTVMAIKMRYFIIHVWQDISKNSARPPPVFPFSTTTDPAEVKVIREKLVADAYTEITQVLAKMRRLQGKKLDVDSAEIEDNVSSVPEEICPVNHIKKLTEKRGRFIRKKKSYMLSWPEMCLVSYFMPSRHFSKVPVVNGPNCMHCIQVMCALLQVQFDRFCADTPDMKELLKVGLDSEDANVHSNLKGVLSHVSAQVSRSSELSCIPFIPPSHTTLGALRSFLIHRSKLREMARGDFLLYNVRHDELIQLGDHMKPVGTLISQGDHSVRQLDEASDAARKIHVTFKDGNPESKKRKNNANNQNWKRLKKGGTYSRLDDSKSASSQQNLDKLRVSSVDEPIAVASISLNESQAEISQEERVRGNKRIHTSGMSTQASPVHFVNENDKQNIFKEEDDLLFHRLLSVFFYPGLMEFIQPPAEVSEKAAQLMVRKKEAYIPKSYHKVAVPSEFRKRNGILPLLDISDTEEILHKLENKYAAWMEKKKAALKPSCHGVEGGASSDGKGPGTATKEEEDALEEAMMSKMTTVQGRKARVCSGTSKKSILRLKRSLVMKKAWENRRQGVAAPRKQKTGFLDYVPRPSRTRNKVRDIYKPRKMNFDKNPAYPFQVNLVTEMEVKDMGVSGGSDMSWKPEEQSNAKCTPSIYSSGGRGENVESGDVPVADAPERSSEKRKCQSEGNSVAPQRRTKRKLSVPLKLTAQL